MYKVIENQDECGKVKNSPRKEIFYYIQLRFLLQHIDARIYTGACFLSSVSREE